MVWITYESFVLIVAASLALILMVAVLRFRQAPDALAFAGLMLSVFMWTLGYGLELASHSLQLKLFWHNLQQTGRLGSALAWLWLALMHGPKKKWLTVRYMLPASLVLVIAVVLIWTNQWHQVMLEATPNPSGSPDVAPVKKTPLFLAFSIYAFLLKILSLMLFIQAYRRFSFPHHRQYLIYIISLFLPLLISLIHGAGLNPLDPFDPSPLFLVAGGLLVALTFYRRPIVRAKLLDHLQDGIIVTDCSGMITDLNRAALQLLTQESSVTKPHTLLGQPLAEMIQKWPEWTKAYTTCQESTQHLEIRTEANRFYEIKISPINNRQGTSIGHLTVIHDISRRKQIENTLIKQATTDYLTGIHNRRHFIGLSEHQFQIAIRYDKPISLIMIDIDYFKQINDTYGHVAGDMVLTQFVNICISFLRRADIFGRMGGEEFAITLPETPLDGAKVVAEKIRRAIEQSTFVIDGTPIRFTISAGVVTKTEHDASFSSLIRRADQLLYKAKKKRNCVRVQ